MEQRNSSNAPEFFSLLLFVLIGRRKNLVSNTLNIILIMSEEKSQCHEAAKALALCIEEGPCVKERGLTVVECIKAKDTLGCEKYVTGYFGCRKMMLDMRSRIRGNRYAEVSKEKE